MRTIRWNDDSFETSGRFAATLIGEARIGRAGPGDFEIDIGRTTAGPFTAPQTGQFVWVSGQWEPFTLTVDPIAATARLTVRTTSVVWSPATPALPDTLFLRVRSARADTTAALDSLRITSAGLATPVVPIPEPDASPGPAALAVSGADIRAALQVADAVRAGFTLTGRVAFTWAGSVPTGSALSMQLKVGRFAAVDAGPEEDHRPRRRPKVYGADLVTLFDLIEHRRPLAPLRRGDDREEGQP